MAASYSFIYTKEAMTEQNLKATIRRDIEAILPLDKLEQTHKNDTLAWIDSGAPLFRVAKPDVPPKHLVSYFALIDQNSRKILLCDHIKAQLWLPSGGHVGVNEHPKITVEREAVEELGQKARFLRGNDRPFFVTVTQTVGLTPGHTDVSLWYLLSGNSHEYVAFEAREFNDVEWFSFDEILEMDAVIFDPNMKRFTQKLIAYLA
jgi:8-oxo-dGTP pyrophosphatase MutT (NUDIX family)